MFIVYIIPMNTINGRKTTTITLTTAVYNDLKFITRKGEPFDRTVSFLLRLYHYICKENETNRDGVGELLVED